MESLLRDCFLSAYISPILGLYNNVLSSINFISLSAPTVFLHGRAFSTLKQIGSGGYSCVYLAKEASTGQTYALKRVVCGCPEHLEAAEREASVQRSVGPHPNLLPLLDSTCNIPASTSHPSATSGSRSVATDGSYSHVGGVNGGSSSISSAGAPQRGNSTSIDYEATHHIDLQQPLVARSHQPHHAQAEPEWPRHVYLLFPAYTDGSLGEHLEALYAARQGGAAAGGGAGNAAAASASLAPDWSEPTALLPTADVLDIIAQVCRGVAHMHARGYAHRDLKPHNVLITRPSHESHLQQPQQQGQVQLQRNQLSAGQADADIEAGAGPLTAPLQGGQWQRYGSGPDGGSSSSSSRYRAVVMDFGSARPRVAEIRSRSEALALQEDAEAHCTAPYRAPEFMDVPHPASIDQGAADVWSLGCTLYAVMYGQSPFGFTLARNKGASLALAVLNRSIPWPCQPQACYPQQLHDLVLACLEHQPENRPSAVGLLARVEQLQGMGLRDPASIQGTGRA